MTSISQNLRYLPHTLETRYHAVKTYQNGASVAFICRRYKVSKASLMRWNKRFDGTKESLKDRSHRPLTPHPKAHTEQELTWIKNCIKEIQTQPSSKSSISSKRIRDMIDTLAHSFES